MKFIVESLPVWFFEGVYNCGTIGNRENELIE
jgi:hypothetical protein